MSRVNAKGNLDEKTDRKEKILDASLEIISEEGLRGLTYRAIAKRANVPLGSTTYYFSSIEDIYISAYHRFVTLTDHHVGALRNQATSLLMAYHRSNTPLKEKNDALIEELSAFLSSYIRTLAIEEIKYRKIEAAFLHCAFSNIQIKSLLRERKELFVDDSERWFFELGIANPRKAAICFVSLMFQLEETTVLSKRKSFDKKFAHDTFSFFFSMILAETNQSS